MSRSARRTVGSTNAESKRTQTFANADVRSRDVRGPWGRVFPGIGRPRKRILGIEMAGEVEAVGRSVTRFRPGDRVFGAAVAIPDGALTAHTFIRDLGQVQSGTRALAVGACIWLGPGATAALAHLHRP